MKCYFAAKRNSAVVPAVFYRSISQKTGHKRYGGPKAEENSHIIWRARIYRWEWHKPVGLASGERYTKESDPSYPRKMRRAIRARRGDWSPANALWRVMHLLDISAAAFRRRLLLLFYHLPFALCPAIYLREREKSKVSNLMSEKRKEERGRTRLSSCMADFQWLCVCHGSVPPLSRPRWDPPSFITRKNDPCF